MNKNLILISLLILSAGVSAQDFTKINFEKTVINFGNIKEEDGSVTATFIFKNEGKNPFLISKVKSSCGCTTPSYSKEPVKPGKKGFINAVYNPANVSGEFDKYITISGNIKTNINLVVKGSVTPRKKTILDDYPFIAGNLRFERKQILFGDIFDKSIDTALIRVYNPSDKAVTIKKMISPLYIGSMQFPMKIGPGDKKTIMVFYNAPMRNDLGYLFDDISLETNDPILPEIPLVVVANIIQDFEHMSPDELKETARIKFDKLTHDFGDVQEGKVVTTTFWLKNEGKTKLTIYDIETSCGCTATTLGLRKLEPGETTQMKVVFHTKGRQGPQTKLIKVKSNDPFNKTMVITIQANVVNTR